MATFPAKTSLSAELNIEGAAVLNIDNGWRIRPTKTGVLKGELHVPQCPIQEINIDVSSGSGEKEVRISLDCEKSYQGFVFRLIPPGSFNMGSPPDEPGREPDELLHPVELTQAYWLSSTEVTQSFFQRISGENPALRKVEECMLLGNTAEPVANQPVYCLSWYEALAFANRLSIKQGLTSCYDLATQNTVWKTECKGFRLPTEAEWEYAAAAGGSFTYSGSDNATEVAWYKNNSAGYSHEVGQKKANAFGLYDMSGNVSEWVWDIYEAHKNDAELDPTGPKQGVGRLLRGGSWLDPMKRVRHSDRLDLVPYYKKDTAGFRLAKTYDPNDG